MRRPANPNPGTGREARSGDVPPDRLHRLSVSVPHLIRGPLRKGRPSVVKQAASSVGIALLGALIATPRMRRKASYKAAEFTTDAPAHTPTLTATEQARS